MEKKIDMTTRESVSADSPKLALRPSTVEYCKFKVPTLQYENLIRTLGEESIVVVVVVVLLHAYLSAINKQ